MYYERRSDGEALRVLGQNPFEGITTKTRMRQLLQTHQGRDKVFKVAQYCLRLRLWWQSVDVNLNYLPGEDYSRLERNLMTIVNSRRLFRLGRFFGEFIRLRVTLIKASELVYTPFKGGMWIALFIQFQMMLDIIARALLFVKSFCEDVAFLVQKGFFHSHVAGRLIAIATWCGLPILTIDLLLNTLRLHQNLRDAAAPESADEVEFTTRSYSLLSKYDRVDKLRRCITNNKHVQEVKSATKHEAHEHKQAGANALTASSPASAGVETTADDRVATTIGNTLSNDSIVYVNSYLELFWTDFELHWVCVTETKLLLDIFVYLANVRHWKGMQGYSSDNDDDDSTPTVPDVRAYVRGLCGRVYAAVAAVTSLCGDVDQSVTLNESTVDAISGQYELAISALAQTDTCLCVAVALHHLLGVHSSTNNAVTARAAALARALSAPASYDGDDEFAPHQGGTAVCCADASSSNTRHLHLREHHMHMVEWHSILAPLFATSEQLPTCVHARLSCTAERPLRTAPCFQQYVLHTRRDETDVYTTRLATILAEEVL